MTTRVRFLAAFALLAPSVYAQKIYWAETIDLPLPQQDLYLIRRADPDGSNIEDAVNSPFPVSALAIDSPQAQVYWNAGWRDIYRAQPDGAGVTHFLNEPDLEGIAVDMIRRKLYWAFGSGFVEGIRRANLDGSDIEWILGEWPSSNVSARRLTIHAGDGRLYWTEPGHDRIMRANLDGTDPTVVLITSPPLDAWGIALDPPRWKLYWTAIDLADLIVPGKIRRAKLDGTQIEDLATLAPGFYSEIAVDPYLGKIYWTDRFLVRRANLDGTNAENIVTTGEEWDGPIAVDARPPIPAMSAWGIALMGASLLAAGGLVILRRPSLVRHVGAIPTGAW